MTPVTKFVCYSILLFCQIFFFHLEFLKLFHSRPINAFLHFNMGLDVRKPNFVAWADPEGDDDPLPHPLKKYKIGFLSNTGPGPLKNHEAAKPAFNDGPSSARQRNTWRADGGPSYSGIWILFPLIR